MSPSHSCSLLPAMCAASRSSAVTSSRRAWLPIACCAAASPANAYDNAPGSETRRAVATASSPTATRRSGLRSSRRQAARRARRRARSGVSSSPTAASASSSSARTRRSPAGRPHDPAAVTERCGREILRGPGGTRQRGSLQKASWRAACHRSDRAPHRERARAPARRRGQAESRAQAPAGRSRTAGQPLRARARESPPPPPDARARRRRWDRPRAGRGRSGGRSPSGCAGRRRRASRSLHLRDDGGRGGGREEARRRACPARARA